MKKDIFLLAVQWMKSYGRVIYGPESFQEYLTKNNLPITNTAQSISIDSLEKLNPFLRFEKVMVFRLGQSDGGRGTQFALRRAEALDEYFLIDEKVFTDSIGQEISIEETILLPFRVLKNLTETSYVNLAISSGVFSLALGVQGISSPATSQSTFTFQVKLHSQDDELFIHNNGQVEIDSLFLANIGGKQKLYVIEAKSEDTHKSLSKHKLVYPVLSIASNVPKDIDIVPVYLKVNRSQNFIHFHILECNYPDPRNQTTGINELQPKKHSYIRIKFE